MFVRISMFALPWKCTNLA